MKLNLLQQLAARQIQAKNLVFFWQSLKGAWPKANNIIQAPSSSPGPYATPTDQTSLLVLAKGRSCLVEKTDGVTGLVFFNAAGGWQEIEVIERHDVLTPGSSFFAASRNQRPGISRQVGLVNQAPNNFKELSFTLRLCLASQTTDPIFLSRVYADNEEEPAVRLAAYRNPHFQPDAQLPSPATISQFLDDPAAWAGPVTPPNSPAAELTYNISPFAPFAQVVAAPLTPFIHHPEQLTPPVLTKLLRDTRDFFIELAEHGETRIKKDVNQSKQRRLLKPLGPKELDGLVFGWNFGSDIVDKTGFRLFDSGASQAQVHFQFAALTRGSSYWGDQLRERCQLFSLLGLDYLGEYLRASQAGGLEIANFDGTRVIAPFSPRSNHELQVICPQESFLDLSDNEIACLGLAFARVIESFIQLGVRNFNMASLIPRLSDETGIGQRLIFRFLPRWPTGFSEIMGRYVVLAKPEETAYLTKQRS